MVHPSLVKYFGLKSNLVGSVENKWMTIEFDIWESVSNDLKQPNKSSKKDQKKIPKTTPK